MLFYQKFFISIFLLSNLIFVNFAKADDGPQYFDFNAMPAHQLTNKINMRFVTSAKFTVIQWNLKAGAKLLPPHSHPNEQVSRVLEGQLDVLSGTHVYHLHTGDVMVFPPNVPHGFVATTDAVMYEQQTPIREDFLQKGFIEKLSAILRKSQ